MSNTFQEEIRRLTIQALVSDDELMDRLFLKGGNALDLVHKIAERASFDLDFSMVDSFDDSRLDELETKIDKLLEDTFAESGYYVLDIKLSKKPHQSVRPELSEFWGGYEIEFKVIKKAKYQELGGSIDAIRRNSISVGAGGSTKMIVQISRYENCSSFERKEIGGFVVQVYTPTLLAVEKLRAICQQLEEYRKVVLSSTRSPRARDFFDICTIVNTCCIDLLEPANRELIGMVFAAKRVPVGYLKCIEQDREFHRSDFVAVRDTVKPGVVLHDFDYYFDFVKAICQKL